ncbi:MAG: O-antigen ligase family protein [Verrucomicrobiales bacterium]
MPPFLALILTFGGIFVLLRRDLRLEPYTSRAQWLPLFWLFISASRFVSEWLVALGFPVGSGSIEDGSPIDRLVYIAMIVGGVVILNRRQVNLNDLFRKNRYLVAFLAYCLLAVVWSDHPFISLKRWIKVLGHPIMVLVVLTEPDPGAAVRSLFRRSAFIILPLSVLMIKYYPEIGRAYEAWSGDVMLTGVTTNKNLLGATCYLFALFFAWDLLRQFKEPKSLEWKNEVRLSGAFFLIAFWVLLQSNSKTSFVALMVGMAVLWFVNSPSRAPKVGVLILSSLVFVVVVQGVFDVYGLALSLLGKDATLTDRTILWEQLFEMVEDPLLGVGFESFWLGERVEFLWSQERFAFRPNQAHNGYLETYLNLGALGLLFLGALLFSIYRKAKANLIIENRFGAFQMAFLVSAVTYNWTEAAFKTVHFVFLVLYFVTVDYRENVEFDQGHV